MTAGTIRPDASLRDKIFEVLMEPQVDRKPVRCQGTAEEYARADADAVVQLLADEGHYLPGLPCAAQMLHDAQRYAEKLILAQVVAKMIRVLVLGGVVIPETPKAMDWLRDYIDGNLPGHGPLGEPMIWPEKLPGIVKLLREWGFKPSSITPGDAAYVVRDLKPKLATVQ